MQAMRWISWLVLMATLAVVSACSGAPDSQQQSDLPNKRLHATAPVQQYTAAALPLQLLVDAIGTHKFVLLGEWHGTQETPALVADLVEHQVRVHTTGVHEPIILALEIGSDDQPTVDRYMASDGALTDKGALLDGSHWQDAMHDGRDSQAMFDLIERMRELRHGGADVSIDLFDQDGDGERNKRMAEHLRKVVLHAPKATVLVLTGNVHAMTVEPPWKWFDGGKEIKPPMTAGRYLADLHPLSINIDAAGGDAWTCMARKCGVRPMPAHGAPSEATLASADALKSAWDATLTLPQFTASLPAVPNISQ